MCVVIVMVVAYATTLVVNGIPRVMAKRQEIEKIQAENADLKRRLDQKRQFKDDLTSNPTVIDSEIRKQMGYTKKGHSTFSLGE
jgi:cell division protein FtsB